MAQPRPHTVTFVHGATVEDPYHWLRDDSRTNPEIAAFLHAENALAEETLERCGAKRLQEEMLTRIRSRRADDSFAPFRTSRHEYQLVKCPGFQSNYLERRTLPAEPAATERVIDPTPLGPRAQINFFQMSPCEKNVLFGYDCDGNEVNTLRAQCIATHEDLMEPIERVGGGPGDPYYSARWTPDGQFMFYVEAENGTGRRVYRTRVAPGAMRELIYEERNTEFVLSLDTTSSGQYLLLTASTQTTAEVFVLSPEDQVSESCVANLRSLLGRQTDIEYRVQHHGKYLYVVTNADGATNARVIQVPWETRFDKATHRVVLEHDLQQQVLSMETFKNFIVVYELRACARQVRVVAVEGDGDVSSLEENAHFIAFEDPVYSLLPGNFDDGHDNPFREQSHCPFEGEVITLTYSSHTVPRRILAYNLRTREFSTIHEAAGADEFDRSKYKTERAFAKSADGTMVPMSLAYRISEDTRPRPCVIHSYGAYGVLVPLKFSWNIIELLDRGFVYCFAHVRGGGEMGRQWAIDGRRHKKLNSYADFIACAERLIARGTTTANMIATFGRSAGGLLVCGVMNERPDLFAACLAEVPFVDALVGMADTSIPWCEYEFGEWGTSNLPEDYEVLKRYCPVMNVRPQRYPDLFLTGGYNDPRVGYWEPAKMLSRVKAAQTRPDAMTIMRIHFGAGHFALPAEAEADSALQWAWVVQALSRASGRSFELIA